MTFSAEIEEGKMDIELISKGIGLVSTTINTMKTLKDVITSGNKKKDIEEKLTEAENSLKVAEAEMAKGFDYKLCQRHFPPGILLDVDEFKLKCNVCGNVEDYEYGSVKQDNILTIRTIGDQVFQTITGNVLVGKWGIKPQTLLDIVMKNLINAYDPDEDKVVNNEPEKFGITIGFNSENNEIDEDIVMRLRFKPEDIMRFENIYKLIKNPI